jgi:DNA-binding beta-propeller fold protein YncE
MKKTVFLRVVTMGLGLGVAAAGASAQTLLVVNQNDSTVSFVDPNSGTQVAVFEENTPGVHAHEAATSLDGKTANFPIYGSTGVGKPGINGHEMLVVDVASRKIINHVDFGHEVRPHFPIMDPVTHMLYVSTELDNAITVIDPKTLKIVGKIPTGSEQSHMFILSHDSKRAYTANVGPGTVSVLDVPRRKTIAVIPISGNTQRISISNDDKWVFTADQTKPQLAVIDTSTNKVKTWIPLSGTAYGTAPTKDGKSLLVTIPGKAQIAVVDLATMKVARTIDVQPTPQEVLVRPDGKMAYVSCDKSAKVAVIDLDTMSVAKFISVGQKDDGLAWAR